MRRFRQFVEVNDKRKICSFDFDGVLHRSVWTGTIHPIDFWHWRTWIPNETIHAIVKSEAKTNEIVVVSRRDSMNKEPMWKFIQHYRLPISEIYTTDNGPKRNILVAIGAVRHYDDDPHLATELADTGIQFILVDPTK